MAREKQETLRRLSTAVLSLFHHSKVLTKVITLLCNKDLISTMWRHRGEISLMDMLLSFSGMFLIIYVTQEVGENLIVIIQGARDRVKVH